MKKKEKRKNCQNGQWNFLTRSRIKKAMHAYSTRIDDSIPIQGTRGGGGKKKKKVSAKRAGERIFWPCLCPIKKTKKKKTNFSLRKQAYGFVRFLLFFPLFLFLSNVIYFFFPPFLFSLFFLFFFPLFFFFLSFRHTESRI